MDVYKKGGGIGFIVKYVRKVIEEEFYMLFRKRFVRMLRLGIILVEVKSGYGLDVELEMKMLRVFEKVKKELFIEIFSIFCGVYFVFK